MLRWAKKLVKFLERTNVVGTVVTPKERVSDAHGRSQGVMKVSDVRSGTTSKWTAFTVRETNIQICLHECWLADHSIFGENRNSIIHFNFFKNWSWPYLFERKLSYNLRLRSDRLAATNHTLVGDESYIRTELNYVELTAERG